VLFALEISALAHLGRFEEARAAYERWRKLSGLAPEVHIPLVEVMSPLPLKDRRVADSYAEGLLKAGMAGQLSDYIHVTKEDQLTEQDLRALAGTTVVHLNPDGSQWSWEGNKDGDKGIYRGLPWGLAEGTPWTGEDTTRVRYEGDSRCVQYDRSSTAFGG
jgi:hypothetical protein